MFNWTLTSRARRLLALLGEVSVAVLASITFSLAYECQTNGYCIAPFTPGTTSGETLNLDYYTITTANGQSNPTVLNMWIRNTGASAVAISDLSLRDLTSGGNPVSFQTPISIAPGATTSLSVDTSNSGFYFTEGHSYSLIVVTSKSAQFTFSVNY